MTLFEKLYISADEDGRYALAERAAIIEHDANQPRDCAETLAALHYFSQQLNDHIQPIDQHPGHSISM